MSLAPRIRPAPVEESREEKSALQIVREQVVIKEAVAPKGWRFVPHRDENNLIVEIIATPLT